MSKIIYILLILLVACDVSASKAPFIVTSCSKVDDIYTDSEKYTYYVCKGENDYYISFLDKEGKFKVGDTLHIEK